MWPVLDRPWRPPRGSRPVRVRVRVRVSVRVRVRVSVRIGVRVKVKVRVRVRNEPVVSSLAMVKHMYQIRFGVVSRVRVGVMLWAGKGMNGVIKGKVVA